MAITLVVWFRTLSAIFSENLGGGSCSCCCCYYAKVKSTPSLDLALGVWQKYVGPTRVKGDGKVGSCHSIEFYHLYKFSVAIVTKKYPVF